MPAIVTLTLNPAVDISTSTPQVRPAHKLRCTAPIRHPGGGGINVARVLHRLGADCLALYPRGGPSGQVLSQLLEEEGVPHRPIEISGETRESFSVYDDTSHQEFRFVLPGPSLSPLEAQSCLDELSRLAPAPQFLVLSGSLPPGTPDDFYAQIIRHHRNSGNTTTRIVLDTSGQPLRRALSEGVALFKPSLRELEELTGTALPHNTDRINAARQLITSHQTQRVALSLGEEGALLISEQHAWFAPALNVPVASTIGAGDSFVAGLTWAFSQSFAEEDAFVFGIAAATAALLSSGTALCSTADIERLRPLVHIRPAQ